MPLRPRACCQAVHRVSTRNEALWITDDILSSTFLRFCANNKPARRHGSNVPGPMESRRRLGRRRMTHITHMDPTEHALPPWVDLTALREALGWNDQTKWRYEPPTIKPQEPEPEVKLPAWLTDYKPLPPEPEEIMEEEMIDPMFMDLRDQESKEFTRRDMLRDLEKFGRSIATMQRTGWICSAFNKKIKRNLSLGQMSDDDLALCLQDITNHLRTGVSSEALFSKLSIRFYKAVWEGMASCESLGPRDFGGRVLNDFLLLISQVQHNSEVELLVTRILSMVSEHQVFQLHEGFRTVAKGWVSSWIEPSTWNAQLSPDTEASILALANALNYLPRNRALDILTQLTFDFSQEESRYQVQELVAFRFTWLNLVSHIKGVEEEMLGDIWAAVDELVGNRMEALKSQNVSIRHVPRHLKIPQCCDVVLNHWISSNLIKSPRAVRNTLGMLMLTKAPVKKLSCLIAALDRHSERCHRRTLILTRLLGRLGFYSAIDEIFRHLPGLGVRFPADVMGALIVRTFRMDFKVALRIYKVYPKIRQDYTCLTTVVDRHAPEFYLHMIRSKMYPTDIWKLLRIPLYYKIWQRPDHLGFGARRNKKLSEERITLICRMAIEFAHAKYLRPRQSRRNIEQCMCYLRRHHVSFVGRTLISRALVHAVITRETVKGKWVGRNVLMWVINYVWMCEGPEASHGLVRAVLKWNSEYMAVQRRRARDAHPLRLGPID